MSAGPGRAGGGDRRGRDVPLPADAGAAPGQRAGGYLGLLLILAGLALLCGFTVHTAKLVLLVVILWAVNPVSAHLIARMEVITGLGMEPDHLQEKGEQEL